MDARAPKTSLRSVQALARRARAGALGLGLAMLVVPPADASIPLTTNTTNGYRFSGFAREVHIGAQGPVPLGPDFLSTDALVEFILNDWQGDYTISLPGAQIGDTIVVETGDVFTFTFTFAGSLLVTIEDVDPINDFGGGVTSPLVLNPDSQFLAVGTFTVDESMVNLGIGGDPSDISGGFLFGVDSHFDTVLGDFDGDGLPDTLRVNTPVLSGSGADAPDFTTSVVSGSTVEHSIVLPTAAQFEGGVEINPSASLTYDVVAWDFELDLQVAAVPEPATAALVGMALAALLGARAVSRAAANSRR